MTREQRKTEGYKQLYSIETIRDVPPYYYPEPTCIQRGCQRLHFLLRLFFLSLRLFKSITGLFWENFQSSLTSHSAQEARRAAIARTPRLREVYTPLPRATSLPALFSSITLPTPRGISSDTMSASSIISRGSETLDVFTRRSQPKIELNLAGQKPGLVNSYTTGDHIEGTAMITVDQETRFDEVEIIFQGAKLRSSSLVESFTDLDQACLAPQSSAHHAPAVQARSRCSSSCDSLSQRQNIQLHDYSRLAAHTHSPLHSSFQIDCYRRCAHMQRRIPTSNSLTPCSHQHWETPCSLETARRFSTTWRLT